MKAVLLVGGEGTRLRPLTLDLPKPLFPIVGIPYLEHLVSYLKAYEIDEIILTACYLSEQIREFCRLHSNPRLKLTYVFEESPLGTGGAVKNVAGHLHDTFLVFNGDILTDFDLQQLFDFHRKKKSLLTIALTSVKDPSRYGVAKLTDQGQIQEFIEKPKREEAPSSFINAGIYIVEPKALTKIPQGEKISIEREVFPQLAAEQSLFGLVLEGYWLDMGTPADYLQAHADFLDGKISLETGTKRVDRNWLGKALSIDSDVKIIPPVFIGDGSRLERGSKIGPGTVIGKKCVIHAGAFIEKSVLWDNVTIGAGADISGSIIADGTKVPPTANVVTQLLRPE